MTNHSLLIKVFIKKSLDIKGYLHIKKLDA